MAAALVTLPFDLRKSAWTYSTSKRSTACRRASRSEQTSTLEIGAWSFSVALAQSLLAQLDPTSVVSLLEAFSKKAAKRCGRPHRLGEVRA